MKNRLLLPALLAAFLPACFLPSGRIKSDEELVGVDARRAGTATYDRITAETLGKLLDRHASLVNVQDEHGMLVAFVGIDTLGAEEMRDHKAAMYDTVEEVLANSGLYQMVSMRMVNSARQEIGMARTEDLFVARNRQAFLDALGEQGLAPDYFVFGTLTTQSSDVALGSRERRYRMSMEMVDTRTGQLVAKESGTLTKAYLN